MHAFLYINWSPNPDIFRVGRFALRHYSLMFVLDSPICRAYSSQPRIPGIHLSVIIETEDV